MGLINIEKKRAVIKFNTNFYNDSSVTAALTRFWGIFRNEFTVLFTTRERKPKYLTVVLKPRNKKTIDKGKVLDFCNFALKKEIIGGK